MESSPVLVRFDSFIVDSDTNKKRKSRNKLTRQTVEFRVQKNINPIKLIQINGAIRSYSCNNSEPKPNIGQSKRQQPVILNDSLLVALEQDPDERLGEVVHVDGAVQLARGPGGKAGVGGQDAAWPGTVHNEALRRVGIGDLAQPLFHQPLCDGVSAGCMDESTHARAGVGVWRG